jgi:hypothetical protein
MKTFTGLCILFAALLFAGTAKAGEFDGTWEYRKCFSKKEGDCDSYYFSLVQKSDRLCGQHSGSSRELNQLNEGGPVHGIVVGKTAVLTVTSGRNGEIVLGKANLIAKNLRWETVQRIYEAKSDDALILDRGVLKKMVLKKGQAAFECSVD